MSDIPGSASKVNLAASNNFFTISSPVFNAMGGSTSDLNASTNGPSDKSPNQWAQFTSQTFGGTPTSSNITRTSAKRNPRIAAAIPWSLRRSANDPATFVGG